jgi:hypothetical protein
VGDAVDIKKAKILILEKDGSKDIARVEIWLHWCCIKGRWLRLPAFYFFHQVVSATTYEQHRDSPANYTSLVYAIPRLDGLLQDNKQHY